MLSLKQDDTTPADACCSISLAAPQCAPSAPTSSGEEPVQSYRFRSRRGYSLQVGFTSTTLPSSSTCVSHTRQNIVPPPCTLRGSEHSSQANLAMTSYSMTPQQGLF